MVNRQDIYISARNCFLSTPVVGSQSKATEGTAMYMCIVHVWMNPVEGLIAHVYTLTLSTQHWHHVSDRSCVSTLVDRGLRVVVCMTPVG